MARIDLIQEQYAADPWKIMICCILLNQTTNQQVRKIIQEFFERWPDPSSILKEDVSTISSFIRSTGFQNVKAKRIQDFSQAWKKGLRDYKLLPGLGEYARDTWRIFVDNDFDFIPKDKKLRMYLDK